MRSIIAISSDGLLSPKFTIHPAQSAGAQAPFGWGVGWYPSNQTAAVVHKEPIVREGSISSDQVIDCLSFRSKIFISKLKGGDQGYTHLETQPFAKSFAGSDWQLAHSGALDKQQLENALASGSRFLEPLGRTDSERAFCFILSQVKQTDARSLREIEPEKLLSWFHILDEMGEADIVLTDGVSVLGYHGAHSKENLYFSRIGPPSTESSYVSIRSDLNFEDPRDQYRTKLVIASDLFSSGQWTQMAPGQLLIACNGAVVWNSHPNQSGVNTASYLAQPPQPYQSSTQGFCSMQSEQAQSNQMIMNPRAITRAADGSELSYRTFEITHSTQYEYSEPVLHSTHSFRLQPMETSIQAVEYSILNISSPGERVQYEDVFGNEVLHYTIHEPYTSLTVENKSRVKVYARAADDNSLSKRQTTIPLAWMPWQRQMMTPYLLPQELPDTQLEELTNYAMSFVERNGYHLLDTLQDINQTIYRDYEYSQGNTSADTTPFEVYTRRLGVCQDFANILICMARLLGIPARYQMGYIYTGANYENKIQSDASHAWVELYLPYIGWRGYDPTNGCLVAQDHISVARGRNYRDATPTKGTLFKGGGCESLTVNVKVEEV